jgi:hypothetical protein
LTRSRNECGGGALRKREFLVGKRTSETTQISSRTVTTVVLMYGTWWAKGTEGLFFSQTVVAGGLQSRVARHQR